MIDADGDHAIPLKGVATVYELASLALERNVRLARLAGDLATGKRVDYEGLLKAGQVLAPLDHPEPARFLITGTGLTHTGSAAARNKMHAATHGSGAPEFGLDEDVSHGN